MNQSPTRFDTPTKQHSKLDIRLRKSGVPVSLKRSPQFHHLDCFMLTYFHLSPFAEQILSYDDSLINEEGVTMLLQRLFLQLLYCKKKDTCALELYSFMKDDYDTRYKNVDEFLVHFFDKIDESISKYKTMLNDLVEEHPIRELFIGKTIQKENELSFNIIKLNLYEDSLQQAMQKNFNDQDNYFLYLPKVIQFEIEKSQKLILQPIIHLDEFMYSNKGLIKQHQQDVQELKLQRDQILEKIKTIENYQQTGISLQQLLQMSIDLIQENREEILQGDPAIEGLVELIINSNQELEKLKIELLNIDQQIKLIMGNFNKIQYQLFSVIILDGDYECVYIRNNEQCFFFEDSYAEVKKEFKIEMAHSSNAIVYLIYTDTNLQCEYSYTGGQGNLLEMDDKKPYDELVRKELKEYANKFNQQEDQELYQYKQQQQAEEVFQQYLIRYNEIINLISKRYAYQVPILTNFATFLYSQGRKVDDFLKWQILDCSVRDVTGQSIQEIKSMNVFAQKLYLLFQNQPQKAPSLLTVSKREMQILQIRLQDYVQQLQITKILIYAMECILQEKCVSALNSLRAIYEFNYKNTLVSISQEVLKAFLIGLGNNLFTLHQSGQYQELWDNLQWIITYWSYLFQTDLVHQQLYQMIKDIKKRANKKALNSDQLKIIKKFLTAVEEKKSFEIGTNILLKRDPILESLIIIDWNQDNYYWLIDNNEDLTQQLLNQIQLIQETLRNEFIFVKTIIQQQETFNYDQRIKMQLHCPA